MLANGSGRSLFIMESENNGESRFVTEDRGAIYAAS